MSGKKQVLFLFEESPASHLRFFEGMRMALGFSVTHHGMDVLLLGNAVRAVRDFRPEEIGLPREMLEFFPLRDLDRGPGQSRTEVFEIHIRRRAAGR